MTEVEVFVPDPDAEAEEAERRRKGEAFKRRLDVLEREKRFLQYRAMGYNQLEAAHAVGINDKGNASRLQKRALRRITERPAMDVLAMELAKLDAMEMGVMPKAMGGDTWAVSTMLNIMTRRAAYLGLDNLQVADPAQDAVAALGSFLADAQRLADIIESNPAGVIDGEVVDEPVDNPVDGH